MRSFVLQITVLHLILFLELALSKVGNLAPQGNYLRRSYYEGPQLPNLSETRGPNNDESSTGIETTVKPAITSSLNRSKRNLVNLNYMLQCGTKCSPLTYNGYGCYCGLSGSGSPVDNIDRCCEKHDWCYRATGCPAYMKYFVPYYWKCHNGKTPKCIGHWYWGGQDKCARRLCNCDRKFVKCLKKHPCPSAKVYCRLS